MAKVVLIFIGCTINRKLLLKIMQSNWMLYQLYFHFNQNKNENLQLVIPVDKYV
jgi:hypothetical protein